MCSALPESSPSPALSRTHSSCLKTITEVPHILQTTKGRLVTVDLRAGPRSPAFWVSVASIANPASVCACVRTHTRIHACVHNLLLLFFHVLHSQDHSAVLSPYPKAVTLFCPPLWAPAASSASCPLFQPWQGTSERSREPADSHVRTGF